jgi:hypothetical protein
MGQASYFCNEPMPPEDQQALIHYSREIAKILHRNSAAEAIDTLAGIEQVVRAQLLEHVSPQVGLFLSSKLPEPRKAAPGN